MHNNKLKEYNIINRSFKKKLVFNLGDDAGFYSEFNNMVFAIVYCLKYEYQFILYSANANFRTKNGWTDFFEPFCNSTTFFLHKYFNKRQEKQKISGKKVLVYPLWCIYRLFSPNVYLTYELWNNFYNPAFEKEMFDIPTLNIKGSLRDASREIVNMIYNFNPPVRRKISTLVDGLKLPAKYCSMHIRRGDKNIEFNFVNIENYLDKLNQLGVEKNIFIFTDDYRVITEIKEKCADISIYTFTGKNEFGYIHSNFRQLSPKDKEEQMIKLFATIEVMTRSFFCIGAFTTNPGLFLGMRMPEQKFHSIQRKSWYQFDVEDIIDEMAK